LDIAVRLKCKTGGDDDPMVNDIITNIRVLPGVAIARQIRPVRQLQGGKEVLEIQIKFHNESGTIGEMLDDLGAKIRHLTGVEIAMFLSVGGRAIRRPDGTAYIY
jgi:hypothetical protein